MNKLHREEAALAVIEAGVKLLKGKGPSEACFPPKGTGCNLGCYSSGVEEGRAFDNLKQ